MNITFSERDREALYRVMHFRRDIRHFSSDPLSFDTLLRILEAAHHAPSVGFMQPWNFILITSLVIRKKVKALFQKTNSEELKRLKNLNRKNLYGSLKLEGILESPLNIAVTCDQNRDFPFVLGRRPMPETDLFSTCLAVQNMWLAARAEGIGIGWVSLFDRKAVERLLRLPRKVRLVAYLCVGYPIEFPSKPMLEEAGWKSRTPLDTLIYQDSWGRRPEGLAVPVSLAYLPKKAA